MLQNIPLYIGLRYIRAKRRNSFIAFVSIFAFIGMALGVFALIVVLSVMNGFDRELTQRILRAIPHGYVNPVEPLTDWSTLATEVRAHDSVLGAAPYVQGHGLATYPGSVQGIEIQGIHPSAERDISDIHEFMLRGSIDALEPGEYRIVLGSLLARYLGVSLGDRVNITLPTVAITPAGVFPRNRRFTVVGVFEVGAQVDQNLALVHVQDAQTLFRRGEAIDGLRLRFESIFLAPRQLNQLLATLGPNYSGRDWSQTQGSLFQAVQMEKTVVGVMLGIIILVAAFNIVTTLVLMIAEKRSDIAVLRTLGLPASGVVGIFMVQGIAIGLVGISIGAVFGVLVAENLGPIVAWFERVVGGQIFDPTVYFVTTMPSELVWSDVAWVCGGAALVSVIATCYPAYRAAGIEPAEALRYNT